MISRPKHRQKRKYNPPIDKGRLERAAEHSRAIRAKANLEILIGLKKKRKAN